MDARGPGRSELKDLSFAIFRKELHLKQLQVNRPGSRPRTWPHEMKQNERWISSSNVALEPDLLNVTPCVGIVS